MTNDTTNAACSVTCLQPSGHDGECDAKRCGRPVRSFNGVLEFDTGHKCDLPQGHAGECDVEVKPGPGATTTQPVSDCMAGEHWDGGDSPPTPCGECPSCKAHTQPVSDALERGTINSSDPDVTQVAAALADARHAGGLSKAYYRSADDALERLAERLMNSNATPIQDLLGSLNTEGGPDGD